MTEWWVSMHEKALLFGTDGDWVLCLRAGQHVATEEALGYANSFSNKCNIIGLYGNLVAGKMFTSYNSSL